MNYKKVKDKIYPKNNLENKKRYTVRGLLIKDNKVGLLHIKGDDLAFGKRNHLETPGGGIDENENPIEALKREMLEETGFQITNIKYLTTVSVEYNPLNRIDISKIYVCEIDKDTHQTHLLDYEKGIFNGFDFYDLDTIEETFDKIKDDGVCKIIYERDLFAIRKYKKLLCKK